MKNSLQISENDYMSMNLFSLKWRFTDANHNVLPKDKLLKITPLKKEGASKIYGHSMPFLKDFHLDDNQFRCVEELDDAHKSTATQQWLLKRISNEKKEIVVSWDKENCVLVSP